MKELNKYLEKLLIHKFPWVFFALILVISFASCDFKSKKKSLSICMITRDDLEKRIKRAPTSGKEYLRQAEKFRFDHEQKCYMQDWKISNEIAYVERSSNVLRINLIDMPVNGKKSRIAKIKPTTSQQVLIRPLLAPTFEDGNRFRLDEAEIETVETFQGYKVFRDRKIKYRRILYDKKRPDRLISIFLREDREITRKNISGAIIVFTHVLDKFEVIYEIPSNSDYLIDEIDKEIKRNIITFTQQIENQNGTKHF